MTKAVCLLPVGRGVLEAWFWSRSRLSFRRLRLQWCLSRYKCPGVFTRLELHFLFTKIYMQLWGRACALLCLFSLLCFWRWIKPSIDSERRFSWPTVLQAWNSEIFFKHRKTVSKSGKKSELLTKLYLCVTGTIQIVKNLGLTFGWAELLMTHLNRRKAFNCTQGAFVLVSLCKTTTAETKHVCPKTFKNEETTLLFAG